MLSNPKLPPLTETSRTDLPAWKALEAHRACFSDRAIRDLFDHQPERAAAFTLQDGPISLDFSKNNITADTVELLCDLAEACHLDEWRTSMFSGGPVNTTEQRAALHTALRASHSNGITLDGQDVFHEVQTSLARVEDLVRRINEEGRYTDFVTIGIGGSDIGPHVSCRALKHLFNDGQDVHFLSNVDPSHIHKILSGLNPETTLFIVSSKSFTTQETLTNAHSARDWIIEALGEDHVAKHFVSVTANKEAALKFGVREEYIFPLWNWIGGRFSLWSAIGLPIALVIGFENFKAFLAGAEHADQHFKSRPFSENIPIMMALLGVWHRNFCGYETQAILPYNQYLESFPRYVQQLDMESNGKAVDRDGHRVSYHTAPVIFGDVGTNGQHAFHQHLHQGTQIAPCDFIACIKSQKPRGDHQDKLLANALAQAQALMCGFDNLAEPHRHFEGGRPSNFILLDALTPYSMGMLMAFYEHRVFVQGVIWNLNSFDQYGVELGKTLSRDVLDALQNNSSTHDFDSSTQSLIEKIRNSA